MRRALSLSAVILLLWVGLALAATNVYYSVSPFGTGDIKTGTPTISISSGIATLSVAQTGNIGQGCRITYNTSSVCYISGVIDSTHFNVVTAIGGTPGDIAAGTTVNSIAHEYASLSAAEAGFTDSSHINNNSLVTADVVVNLTCYYDHDDYTPLTSWYSATIITDATRYLRIVAPKGGAQSIYNQRSTSGIWDSNKACLINTTDDAALLINIAVAELEGLQVRTSGATNSVAVVYSGPGNSSLVIKDCIIHRADTASVAGLLYISNGTVIIENTIMYGSTVDRVIYDNWNTVTLNLCNCIISGGTVSGIHNAGGGTWTVTNSIIFNTADDFVGNGSITYTASDDYPAGTGNVNISPGATEATDWAAAFTDYANGDFSLKSGSPLIDAGIGPALDSNVPTTDIVGTSRSGNTCDIGAFEYVEEGGSSPKWNGITPAKWNGVDWSNLKWNGM